MKIPRVWVNHLVEVCFYDHSENTDQVPVLAVRGRLDKLGRKYLRIITTERVSAEELEDDTTSFLVVRSAIQSISLLQREASLFEDRT